MAISTRASVVAEELDQMKSRILELLEEGNTPPDPSIVAAEELSRVKEQILAELGDEAGITGLQIGFRYEGDGVVYSSTFGEELPPTPDEAPPTGEPVDRDELDKHPDRGPLSLYKIDVFVEQIRQEASKKLGQNVSDIFLYGTMNGHKQGYDCPLVCEGRCGWYLGHKWSCEK